MAAQYAEIDSQVDEALARVLRETDYIRGRAVKLFEGEFAEYCHARYAIAVDSGMSALELALRAYGIGIGDQVITAANAPVSIATAISVTGASVILADVDSDTFTVDSEAVEQAITRRTRAIIPVHLHGHPANMDAILEIARRYALIVIEEASDAPGARYNGKPVGALAHAAAFGFGPTQNLGAFGDGGAVVTNDERVADTIRALRGSKPQQEHVYEVRGYNRHLDPLQAAALRVKLGHLEQWNAARSLIAQHYEQSLCDLEIGLPRAAKWAEPVWHRYVIRSVARRRAQDYLSRLGIETGIHYPIPIHLQPAFRHLGYRPGDFPTTESLAQEILSLPMYPELASDTAAMIADAVRHSLKDNRTL